MNPDPIIVIGGGPAGLMAAGQAAKSGCRVLLLEKMQQPGRKLCITGKGRCNLTNITDLPDFIDHFGPQGRFLRQPFNVFFSPELLQFFRGLGLELVNERGGRVFPASGRAADVFQALLTWARQCGVEVRSSSPVQEFVMDRKRVAAVISRGRKIAARAVILATGGASYPGTGSSGDGFRLAGSVGHTVISVRPALVPLETASDIAARMEGLHLRNTGVRLLIDGRKKQALFGELVFMKYGVSGPTVLTLSGAAVDALRAGSRVDLALDLKPALDERKLDARLLRDFAKRSAEPLSSVLRGLLPRQMVPVCLQLTGIPADLPAGQVSAARRRSLRLWLKNFRLQVVRHRPLAEAIVTAGGVDIREIDPRTMQSRLVTGLYVAGEVLDVQGDTGGYNLQAAFSTGWLAGRSAAAMSVTADARSEQEQP